MKIKIARKKILKEGQWPWQTEINRKPPSVWEMDPETGKGRWVDPPSSEPESLRSMEKVIGALNNLFKALPEKAKPYLIDNLKKYIEVWEGGAEEDLSDEEPGLGDI